MIDKHDVVEWKLHIMNRKAVEYELRSIKCFQKQSL